MSAPHSVRRSAHRRAVGTALAVTVLWSSSWVLIRFGLDDEDLAPVTFAGLRYGIAALVLATGVAARPGLRREMGLLRAGELGHLAVLGVLFYAVTQGAQFVAIDTQPAATTSLVLSLTPLLIGVLAGHALLERPSRQQLGGAVLVGVGAWTFLAGDLGFTVVGMAAAGIGLGANVSAALLGRSVNRTGVLSPSLVTTVSMSIGATLLILAGLAVDGPPSLTARAAVLVGWLAVVNTAVAFTLWNRSLRNLSALESAGINNTMLVQIAVLAWVFLGEAPGALGLVGVAVVTAGVALTRARTAPRMSGGSRHG